MRDVPEGRTPLAYAVAKNKEQMVRDLIELGANVNTKMGESTTALTIAATNKKRDGTETVRLLHVTLCVPFVYAFLFSLLFELPFFCARVFSSKIS
jgi:hypothetical protein